MCTPITGFASAFTLPTPATVVANDAQLTFVNGCTTCTVKPPLTMVLGTAPATTVVSLAPGERTVFKLDQAIAYSGIISNGLDTDSSFMRASSVPPQGGSRASWRLTNRRSP